MLPDHLIRNLTKVHPAAAANRWNDAELDYGNAATRTVIRGYLQQASATEQVTDDRSALDSGWLLLTNDLTLDATDQIEDGGKTYRVNGTPWPVERPGSGVHHVEANLRSVEG